MSTRWTLPNETASQIRMVLRMVTGQDGGLLRPEGRELAQRLLDELNKARCVCGRTKAHLMSAGHELSCPHDVDTKGETMTGIERITRERKHQIELGWTPQHDDSEHYVGRLRHAATVMITDGNIKGAPDWAYQLRHKYRGNDKRMLAIAGALIAAELDRLEGADGPS